MIHKGCPLSILSLDPSLNCTGYSVFINEELKDYGNIWFRQVPLKGKGKECIGEKLLIIEKRIKELIEKWNIDLILMEKYMLLFQNNNKSLNTSATTAELLPMVRGVLVKTFFEMGVSHLSIPFNTVKKITARNSSADKNLIKENINKIYELELRTKKDTNISDAIAVGYSFFKIYDLKIQLYPVEDYLKDVLDFFEKYNNIKNKTHKSLKLIGVDINKWKVL